MLTSNELLAAADCAEKYGRFYAYNYFRNDYNNYEWQKLDDDDSIDPKYIKEG